MRFCFSKAREPMIFWNESWFLPKTGPPSSVEFRSLYVSLFNDFWCLTLPSSFLRTTTTFAF